MPDQLFEGSENEDVYDLHNYDDMLDETPIDEQLNEVEDGVEANEPVEEISDKFPRPLQDTRKMLIRMALISGHQSGYKDSPKVDFVDESREKQKLEVSKAAKAFNAEFDKRGGRWADEHKDRPVKYHKPVPSEVKAAADIIGADPSMMRWPKQVADLPLKKKLELLGSVWDGDWSSIPLAKDQAKKWNERIAQPDLRLPTKGSRKYDGTPTIWRDPAAAEQPALVGMAHTFKDQSAKAASDEWKIKAETNQPLFKKSDEQKRIDAENARQRALRRSLEEQIFELKLINQGMAPELVKQEVNKWKAANSPEVKPAKIVDQPSGKVEPVITKCSMTGQSLVERKGARFKSWRVGPNINGMGLAGARLAVEAAAFLSLPIDQLAAAYNVKVEDLAGAKVSGDIPEFVHQLSKDGDGWAILALHTNHPVWGSTAKFLISMRDTLYFKLDEQEARESIRIGQKIAADLEAAYPGYDKVGQ